MSERARPSPIAVGISMAESADMPLLGLGAEHLLDARAELARYLLASNASLVFGGDLHPGDFADVLFELVARHGLDAEAGAGPPILSFVPWPESLAWAGPAMQATARDWAGLVEVRCLGKLGHEMGIDEISSMQPVAATAEEVSMGLVTVRHLLARVTDARVFLGGATDDGPAGAMPGLAQSCLIALEAGQPLFVLGGFGGCARDIACELGLLTEKVSDKVPWPGRSRFADFDAARMHNGLSLQENQQLARTLHIDEALPLILRGLAEVRGAARAPAAAVERLIKRAARLSEHGDRAAAIAELDSAISVPGATADSVADAMLARAALRSADNDAAGERADLDAVLGLPGVGADLRHRALNRRARLREWGEDIEGAIADHSAIAEMPDATAEQREEALVMRGRLRTYRGDPAGAIADYSASLAWSVPRLDVLLLRASARQQCGDWHGVIADCNAVIALDEHRSYEPQAFAYRSAAREMTGDKEGAIEDCTALIEMLVDAPIEDSHHARVASQSRDRLSGGTWRPDPHTDVIETPGADPEDVSRALLARAHERAERGRVEAAIRDYDTVIQRPDTPIDHVVQARLRRGALCTDAEPGLADCTAVLELEGASAHHRANALVTRAAIRLRFGDAEGAMADCTAVAVLPEAPAEFVARATALALTVTIERVDTPPDELAKALNRRAALRMTLEDRSGALADYSRVAGMESAPVERRALALNNRGFERARVAEERAEAKSDYRAVAELPQCPADYTAVAMWNLLTAETLYPDETDRSHAGSTPTMMLFAALGLDPGRQGDSIPDSDIDDAMQALAERVPETGLSHSLPTTESLSRNRSRRASAELELESEKQRRQDQAELLRVLLEKTERTQAPPTPPSERFRR